MGIKRRDLNIGELLKPYEEGGTESSPVSRTIGTMASKLIVSNRIPTEIAGAAIFKVFYKMANDGLEFKGNEKYGSKGKELFSCIKAQAVQMVNEKHQDAVLIKAYERVGCVRHKCPKRTDKMLKSTRWQRIKAFMMRPRGFWGM